MPRLPCRLCVRGGCSTLLVVLLFNLASSDSALLSFNTPTLLGVLLINLAGSDSALLSFDTFDAPAGVAIKRSDTARIPRRESLRLGWPLRGGGLEKKDLPLTERLLDVRLVGSDREFAAGWGGGTRGFDGFEDGKAGEERGDAAMVASDNMMTADQMEAHADIAMEAGEYGEALDLLDVAVNERVDEFGEDSPECIEGYFMYAKCLMLLQNQRDLEDPASSQRPLSRPSAVSASETDNGEEKTGGGEETALGGGEVEDETGEEEDDEPCTVARQMLERSRDILSRASSRPARLADVLELLGRLSLSFPPGQKLGVSRHAEALRCFEECLVLREERSKKGWEKGAEALREARGNLEECRAWASCDAVDS